MSTFDDAGRWVFSRAVFGRTSAGVGFCVMCPERGFVRHILHVFSRLYVQQLPNEGSFGMFWMR